MSKMIKVTDEQKQAKNVIKDGFEIREWSIDANAIKEVNDYFKLVKLSKTDRWLDIGGHIGCFACKAGPKVQKVFSFEPEPENFRLLKRNRNRFDLVGKVVCFRACISNADKKVTLYLNNNRGTCMHSLHVKRGRSEIEVMAYDVNRIIEDHNINAIKCDCEGHEGIILRAITPKNWKKISKLLFEYHFVMLKDRDRSGFYEIIKLLKKRFPNTNIPDRGHTWPCTGAAWK